jgi:tetratricopeptide (TPR) repeat protein
MGPCLQPGRLSAGHRALQERLRALPDDVQARIVLARAEAALGRYEAAFEGFGRALRANPRSADALYFLGITAGVLAQAEYERVLELRPESARAHQLRGESYQAEGRAREAEAEYKAALLANPRSVEVLVALGDLTRLNAAYDEALAYCCGRQVRPEPTSLWARRLPSFRRAARRHRASARRCLSQVAPAHLAGGSLLQTSQTAAAVTELEAAAPGPRMHQAYYLLGRRTRARRPRDAEAAFAKVRSWSGREPRPWADSRSSPAALGPDPHLHACDDER